MELYEISLDLDMLKSDEGVTFEFPLGGAVLSSRVNASGRAAFAILADKSEEPVELHFIARAIGDDVSECDWSHWVTALQVNGTAGSHVFQVFEVEVPESED